MRILLSLSLFLFSFRVYSQDVLLKGTIGKIPIVMQLKVFDDTVATARYYYETRKMDIELDGKISKDGSIRMVCYNNYEGSFDGKSERFELKKINGHFKGKWVSLKKTLPVDLAPFSIDSILHPFRNYARVAGLKKENPLDYVRSAGLSFIKDSTTSKAGYYLDWYHEKYSRISFPRLRKETMTEALKKANANLEEIHIFESLSFLTCTSGIGETEWSSQIDHLFITKEIFSIDLVSSYYCGGAHPDFSFGAYNFDLSTGNLLELDEVLWFGNGTPPNKNTDKWYRYRDSIFAPKLTSILKQLYPEQMKADNSRDGCDYSDPDVWNFANWYFTEEGLYVGAYFARVSRSCDEPDWSIIPYTIVRKYLPRTSGLHLPGKE